MEFSCGHQCAPEALAFRMSRLRNNSTLGICNVGAPIYIYIYISRWHTRRITVGVRVRDLGFGIPRSVWILPLNRMQICVEHAWFTGCSTFQRPWAWVLNLFT